MSLISNLFLWTNRQDSVSKMQQEVAVKISSAEEEGANDNTSSVEIKELFFYWSRTQAIVEKCHLNKAVVNMSINLLSDNVIDHFRKIMKSRHY